MPKRILILSDAILAPSFAPRLTSMIHYLQQDGWTCTLASDNLAGQEYWTTMCRQVNMTYLPEDLSFFAHLRKRIADKLFFARERQFTKLLLSQFSAADFDLIFCSTFYYFPLKTAYSLSKAWHIPFVADVRDIAEQFGKTPYFTTQLPKLFGLERLMAKAYERRCIRHRNKYLSHAAHVTTVSNWHCQCLQAQVSAPVSLIYNGYDEREMMPKDTPSSSFSIAFTGRLINLKLRQPQLLFQAVGELAANHSPLTDHLSLDFYCEPHFAKSLTRQAKQYHAEPFLHIHDFISRKKTYQVLTQASILLALGAPSSEQQHGILGTKVFEAIGVEKPFMLIPSDNDELSELIAQTGIGIAAQSVEQIKAFLTDQYAIWQANGFTRQTVANKQIFTRQYQARQFESIFAHVR